MRRARQAAFSCDKPFPEMCGMDAAYLSKMPKKLQYILQSSCTLVRAGSGRCNENPAKGFDISLGQAEV